MPKPVPVPLPMTTMPGRNTQESSGRLINCYAEPLGKEARWPAVRRRVAGLTTFGTTIETGGFRGMIDAGGVLYCIVGQKVYQLFVGGGTGTVLGTLPGTAKCFLAKNNAVPVPDIVAVSPGDGAFTITPTGVNTYPDTDVGQPDSVCFVNGFFFFPNGRGQIIASGLNSTTIGALDFTNADAKPDGLVNSFGWNGQLFLCGTDSIEVWSGALTNPLGFPFNRVTVIQPGLLTAYAIAGYDDGFGASPIYVGSDNGVYALNGYTPSKISPPDLDALIEACDKTTMEASVHTVRGHAFWTLSSDQWTWEFDVHNATWHERQSYLSPRWRGSQTRWAFGKWLCGDTKTGNILQIDTTAQTEVGDPLKLRIESGSNSAFPAFIPVARIDVDVTLGIGTVNGSDPIQTDPAIEIAVSGDGGLNWTVPRQVKLGAQAVATQRVCATRFGRSKSQGVRVRLDVSDPVELGIMGATLSPYGA